MEQLMQGELFHRIGEWVYRFRIAILIMWVLGVLACLPFIPFLVKPFKSTGFIDKTSLSAKADDYISQQLHYNKQRISIIYYSDKLLATQNQFINEINKSLNGLKTIPLEHTIYYPNNKNGQISKDKHSAIAIVSFKTQDNLNTEMVKKIQSVIKKPKKINMILGGEPIFIQSLEKQTQDDLYESDMIAAPVSIIILILVFGTFVAAMVPILLGGACALLILTSLYGLGHLLTLSIFTLNIALLLGLCLSLDYALFIINRFRDELHRNKIVEDALAVTYATAGKAVFFSGLAIFISLSALLIFPVNILCSVGIGGLVAVFISVLMSLTLLPALLGILKQKINALSLFKRKREKRPYGWHWLATKVVKHPVVYFSIVLVMLLFLGYPFLSVRLGISDYHILPEKSEGRQFFAEYNKKFNEKDLTPILLVVTSSKGNITSKSNLYKLYRFVEKVKDNHSISKVYSIVSLDKKMTSQQYYKLYQLKKNDQPKEVSAFFKQTSTNKVTLITVISKYPVNAEKTTLLLDQLKNITIKKPLTVQVTGVSANNDDVLKQVIKLFPYALIWIMLLTYLILLILLKSVFLPLKAILMNVISLSASYGILVFVFQEGHFHQWLNFEPQGMLDVSLLVIIFCAIFGFSMDYEVFLLTRIKECYDIYHDNNKSIVFGIERSARIITSAALIVIFLCGSFMFADVLMVKEFGLGIAVAIFVDAFLVRSLLVPATMAMVKQINWYCPKWLRKILPRDC